MLVPVRSGRPARMADRRRSRPAAIRPLRIGVIGVGSIGRVHARLLADDPDCLLVALADPTPAGGELATELGVTWYRDHETLLAEESLDGVVVAVPTALHASVGLACVSAGVHMLMEKPITDELPAGRDLVSAAEAAGVRIVVGHHRRFDPAVERAREIIAGGELGRLVLVSAIWAARKPDDLLAGRVAVGARGRIRSCINLIHDLDCLRHICGEIVEVSAAIASRAVREFEVEDTAAIVLRFANGALGDRRHSDADRLAVELGGRARTATRSSRGRGRTATGSWGRRARSSSRTSSRGGTTVRALLGQPVRGGSRRPRTADRSRRPDPTFRGRHTRGRTVTDRRS